MKVLLDTNILLRLANSADPDFAVADAATDRLVRVADAVCLVPQTVSEFYVAATRAVKANGLGLSAADARSLADSFVAAFDLLPDPADLTARWLDLMEAHGVTGPNSYDGRLAAAMRCHGLSHLLTFNGRDFRRYPHVAVLAPAAAASP